ncbi:MAG: hypothetical protein MUC59_14560 [Saprospiraceae bacterium]|jgi:hypothetical protein|nr:hypothetical protein [Saprospiraceae bacterium]
MIKRTFWVFIIVLAFCPFVKTQSLTTNLVQTNSNLYYFKGIDIRFNPINFNISYLKLSKEKPCVFGASLYHYWFSNHSHPELKERGDIQAKFFTTISAIAGYRLSITPKRTFLAKLGLAYRLGRENQFYSMIQVSPGSFEVFGRTYKYRDLGFEFSAEQQFRLSYRWSLSLGAGYQYFIAQTTTNHHLWASAGVGYTF